ncbi:hypothetical protein BD324DRAFT_681110 [Kockovaella imperatae]|uniref:U4/U6 snRNA-associated-splicing factor PRP24 n=1 Tax=Kockovaella imperatae TaxID=4999 RepID=A0A1Y1UGP1_9TREE|nr:hypothetical protein BD324DRAFT_681110 [Kockovaella imperatae]ORX37192.1 hypothetical protein BD324DRAFT_681110 [Kockovaella imperatae]
MAREADSVADVDQLTAVLNALELSPDNVPLLLQQYGLLNKLGLAAESANVFEHLSNLIMLDEQTWIKYLDALIAAAPTPLNLESFLDIVEKYSLAETDYLSFKLLDHNLRFILRCAGIPEPLGVDAELEAFLEKETVRSMLKEVVDRGRGLLSQSSALWNSYMDWELSVAEMPQDLEFINGIFVDRLSTPHMDIEETSARFSTFCSQHAPDSYETRLVAATAAAQSAKFKMSGEKRFGRTRSDIEQTITVADPLSSFASYIEWETDPRAKHPKSSKAPRSDPQLISAVFERAVAAYGQAAAAASAVQQETAVDAGYPYKVVEAGIWRRYVDWTEDGDNRASLVQRASRACPQIGAAWKLHLQHLELSAPKEQFETVFQRALGLGLLRQAKDIADIFVSKASHEIRCNPAQVLGTLAHGLETIHGVQNHGDPSLQLETFLLEWVETAASDLIDEALALLEPQNKSRASSHRLILQRTGIEERRKNFDAARSIYTSAMNRSDLDWPEAVSEAWLRFEHIHGTVETLVAAQRAVEVEMLKLARRRERDAAQHMEQYQAEMAATVQSSAEVEVNGAAPEGTDGDETNDAHFKRDRENTTILVSGLPIDADDESIKSHFEVCGHVREVTILKGDATSSALVEFRFADAVPSALEMDRKKFHGQEIGVSMLWRSTLFVTNFPRDMDDAGIRRLFAQYGTVLQTRLPSRKYADSRRFCYVTMDSPASAQEALVLHGMRLGEFGLTVLISDPSAKTKRTDASLVNATVFIGGLTAKTTERDVGEMVKSFGTAKGIKLGWDPIKSICKGFAFVEMQSEAEANACLALTGTEYHGRTLKVELNDPNYAAKRHEKPSQNAAKVAAERRHRSVRLHGLPDGTTEGLLQQALEKIIPVRRVEVFGASHEAVVELEAPSDVGTLLLRTEPFIFEGAHITFTQQSRRAGHAVQKERTSQTNGPAALNFAPRAARKAKVLGKAPAVSRKTALGPGVENPKGGQDSFRDFVQTTNAHRAEKRAAEQAEGDGPSKRSKTE